MSLQSARDALRRGDKNEARRLALAAIQQDPFSEAAWALLMQAARDAEERKRALEKVLRLNPQHAEARELQRQLAAGEAPLQAPAAPQTGQDGVRVYTEGVYEMLWDCAYCGTKKLLGKTHRFCPNCGAAQDPQKRYFPSEEEKIAVKDHVYVGADRVCPACTTPNSGNAEFCIQCGAPLSDAARAKKRADQVRKGAEEWREAGGPPPKPTSGKGWKWLFGGLAAVALAVVVVVFWTKDVAVALDGHSWEREIQIEDYRPRAQSAWCDAMPGDAYNVSRSREVRSYNQVPDGEECSMRREDQGDGTYRQTRECTTRYRSEPVYDYKCRFTVERWAYARSLKAGARDLAPYWPEVDITRAGNCIGCEREGARLAHYYLHLRATDGGEAYACDVAEDLWRNARPGSRWRVEVGVVDGDARCGSLQAWEQ